MNGKRYVVELASEAQLTSVPLEQLELAVCVAGDGGSCLLVYRDNFIAYKVAALAGGRVVTAQVVTETPAKSRKRDAPCLGDGMFLRLEPAAAQGVHA